MYKSFYKLNKKPFETKTDPSFLWLGEKHKEALATLRYGILNNMGFLLLTGDVGTGKTTLINALTENLPQSVLYTYISDPNLEPLDFYNYLAFSFNFKIEISTKSDFLIIFKRFLIKAAQANKKILLIIDEAQLLSDQLLELTRLLSNIDRSKTNILNIFFIGQPEFNQTLLKDQNRSVRQRISLNYDIKAFNNKETQEYINYRLKISGASYDIFSKSAIKKIHSASGGFPRRINIICDHCLLSGFVNEKTIITKKIACECIKDLRLPNESSKNKFFKSKIKNEIKSKSLFFKFGFIILFLIIVAASYIGLKFFNSFPISKKNFQTSIPDKEYQVPPKEEAKIKNKPLDNLIITNIKENNPLQNSEDITHFDKLESNKIEIKNDDPIIALPPFEEKTFILKFKYNTNEFENQELSKIEECADILKKYPESKAMIIGYTDSEGYSQYNLKLSEFRANIVKGYLIGKGIFHERVKSKGMGDKNPIQDNSTPWGRKMNRRVEILIYQNSN
ncbi:MAG: AAA family ATPase [Desulforegulaceae bacterium]|nr:AAA family ATPase [Desulforegulaceae bacterium]